MGKRNESGVSGLGHPCPGSYLTAANDTSVGGVGCKVASKGPGRLLSAEEGPPAGRVPRQSGATLFGRSWDRENQRVKKY